MKFGKEFSSQMVPEWQQAYMDYDYLKTLLKEIIRFKLRTNNAPTRGGAKNHQGGGLNRKMTLYRAFSGLVSTPGRHRRGNPHDVEEGIQLTGTTTTSGPILVNNTADRGYETTFLMAAEEGGEHRKNTCNKSGVYNTFLFIVAVIPYASRLLQCLRRLFEEKNPEQGWNGLKYFLTIVAVCLRTAYSIQKGQIAWRVLAAISSAAAAVFSTYWDFIHDWGLLNRTSKNRWLRDKLLIPQKKVYFIAMILNVLLRFAWIQTILDFNFSFMHRQTMVTVVASLEIIRRGIWNFFRLENEHLNNVGKYRAFKSVPLPFNYDEDEDKDD
ncbi:hypothetical protein BRARA_F00937 [Brassica rapa]|uniref:EXS domain-containing protein n=1 Tax=Brassica campestris TaxID=3711 RepID=A0A397YVT1_BRACM|nr:hypothetical protein BRARA_F00937 [Brassica rapa]